MVRTPDRRQWYQIKNAATGSDQSRPEVLIYDEINSWFGVAAGDLVRELAAIDAPEILVRINSPGGDVFDGIAILNALRGHDARVVVQVDGLAASAASVVAMGGDEIVMNANSQMMLHNAWAVCVGDASDMQNTAEMLERQNANIASVYAARAGGTADDWRAVMADETWLTADEAVQAGLADRVIEAEPQAAAAAERAMASFDRSRFRYSGRQAAPAPKIAARAEIPSATEAEETEKTQEGHMPTLNEGLAERLGIAADAEDEAILAAVDALKVDTEKDEGEPAAAAEPTVDQLPAVAAKFGLTVLDKTVHDKLVADAAAGAEARAQQIRESDERTIVNALRDGKITPASAETWRAQLKTNREGVNALLAVMPKNSAIPVAELGYGAANEDTSIDPEMESTSRKITGKDA